MYMNTYTRAPLGFKETLAAHANRLAIGRLAMGRLAAELRESLTPSQREVVLAALVSAETLVKVSGLNRSQFNALLVLAHCNDLRDLREYFKDQQ
jgi:hypothetical protein